MHRTLNPDTDDLKPAAALLAKRLGRRINPATMWRWHRKGCRGVKLECLRVGGILQTSDAAVTAFIVGQNPGSQPEAEVPSPDIPPARPVTRARKLEAAGLIG